MQKNKSGITMLFLSKIKIFFTQNFITLFFIFIYSVLLILVYRFETYYELKNIYSDFSYFHFLFYLKLCLLEDSQTLLILFSSFLLIFILLFKLPKLRSFILFLFLFLISILFFIFIDFFKIYETAFQKGFIGQEQATALGEMLSSFWAETSFSLLLKTGISFLILIVFFNFKKKEVKSKFFIFLSSFPLLLAFFFALANPFSSLVHQTAVELSVKVSYKKTISLLNELISNPFLNFIKNDPPVVPLASPVPETTLPSKHSKISFDTSSLESIKRYPKNMLIPKNKKYNIIFYFFESTPKEYLKLKINGKEVTPNWNRLSKNSLVFENHYTNYPLSVNALLSVFTSLYPMTGKKSLIETLPDVQLESVSQILFENDYKTMLIHTGGLGYAGQIHFLKHRRFDSIMDYKQLSKLPPYYSQKIGWGVDERAMENPIHDFIKKSQGHPFFISIHPVNPHHPYAYPGKDFEIAGNADSFGNKKEKTWINYLNSLYFADFALGELIKRLEENNELDNTLIFIFADHGEAFYQHKMNYNHPFYLYEENIHVPFMIYNPKLFKKSFHFQGISRHIDLLPTLLDILGIKKELPATGISILSEHKEQMALSYTYWKDEYYSIRDEKWKYILRFQDKMEELYDLDQDPGEKNNLCEIFPDISQRYYQFIIKSRENNVLFYKQLLDKKK
ncbi:MAG: hypothetical protein A2Y41_06715 [Spirochaetes bacterium GWB1_36_13]|nr:MAG: hypothetical protein A2Y41_06715 [Spirochaetes bacterium GWB1_36_13]